MKSRSEKGQGTQVKGEVPLERLRQLLLPMVAGISATKQHLVEWVHSVGLEALSAVLHESAESIAGQKGGRQSERAANHWGKARTELPFGGRRIVIERPRAVRDRRWAGAAQGSERCARRSGFGAALPSAQAAEPARPLAQEEPHLRARRHARGLQGQQRRHGAQAPQGRDDLARERWSRRCCWQSARGP